MGSKYQCPVCRKRLQAVQLVFKSEWDSYHCPSCDGVVLQAGPARSRPMSVLRKWIARSSAAEKEPPTALGRIRDTLWFFLFGLNFYLAIYACFFAANLSAALSIAWFRYRPIGWAREGIIISVLLTAAVYLLLSIPLFIVLMRRTPKSALTVFLVLLLAAVPFLPLHLFLVQPLFARQMHLEDWPEKVVLIDFNLCANEFEHREFREQLIASGKLSIEIENRSQQRIQEAVYTVKAGRATDFWDHNTEYRIVIHDVAAGQRGRFEAQIYFGAIVYMALGGEGASSFTAEATPRILWDGLLMEGGAAPSLTAKPENSQTAIEDCPGYRRPALPWFRRPWRGPEDASRPRR